MMIKNIDNVYLDVVENVLTNGVWKGNRTGTRTLTLPFQHIRYDMSEGFPLLTTKKMPIKTIATELEGFIKGITSKKWYQDKGCKIWNEWANPQVVQQRFDEYENQLTMVLEAQAIEQDEIEDDKDVIKSIQLQEDDLGPIYGYQWRSFNRAYSENDSGTLETVDQLKTIVNMLHKNPNDRRMVCSAWNPQQIDQMALPPCHVMWNVVVIEDTIHLGWHQRSCDLMLGVPFNIASYALLLELLAKESGLKPGVLSGMLADCHIYENHVDGAREQITRNQYKFVPPVVNVSKSEQFNIFDWQATDLELINYFSYPKIDFGGVAV